MWRNLLARIGLTSAWTVQLGVAVCALLTGALLLPILIYFTGVSTLGRYEGASLGNLIRSVYVGLGQGSIASWVVILGPYALYILFKALRAVWRSPA
jgi:hypothetical protein